MSPESKGKFCNHLVFISPTNIEIMQIIALANEDDQIIRPVFPNQQTLRVSGNDANSAEEAYNLQLLSVIFCGHNVVDILCTIIF